MSTVIAPPLAMTDEQRMALEAIARSTTLGHRKVVQAKALLLAADGVGNQRSGQTMPHHQRIGAGLAPTVRGRGCRRCRSHRQGSWTRSWLPEGTVAAVVHDTLHEVPDDGSTHWTTRIMASRFGIGKDTVARIWRTTT